jgi:predicted small secreted protein
MNRLILVLSVLALSAGLSACNTVRGIGQDIQRAGEVLEGAAKK